MAETAGIDRVKRRSVTAGEQGPATQDCQSERSHQPALFARLGGVHAEDVLFTIYDAALALKATLPRLDLAGDIGDTDVCDRQEPALNADYSPNHHCGAATVWRNGPNSGRWKSWQEAQVDRTWNEAVSVP